MTDLGQNPPAQDLYRMKLFTAAGTTIYDWSAKTTPNLGDLLVMKS